LTKSEVAMSKVSGSVKPSIVMGRFLQAISDVDRSAAHAWMVDCLVEWLDAALAVNVGPDAPPDDESAQGRAARLRVLFAESFDPGGDAELSLRDAVEQKPKPQRKPRQPAPKSGGGSSASSFLGQYVAFQLVGVSEVQVGRVVGDDGGKQISVVVLSEDGDESNVTVPRSSVLSSGAEGDVAAKSSLPKLEAVADGDQAVAVSLLTPREPLGRLAAIVGREKPARKFRGHDTKFEVGEVVCAVQYDVAVAGEPNPRRVVVYAVNADPEKGALGHLVITVLRGGAKSEHDVDEKAMHEPIISQFPGPYQVRIGRQVYGFVFEEGERPPYHSHSLFDGC